MNEIEKMELTPEEEAELKAYFGSPQIREDAGLYQFFNKILDTKDTSKVSRLEENELIAVRRLQGITNYAQVFGLNNVASFFKQEAEITLATADSRQGFLINSVITTKRELKSKRGVSSERKKWFGLGKKEEEGE